MIFFSLFTQKKGGEEKKSRIVVLLHISFFVDRKKMATHAYTTKYNPTDAQIKTWSVQRTLDPLVAQVCLRRKRRIFRFFFFFYQCQ